MTQLPFNDSPSRLPYYLMVGLLATSTHYITLLLLSFALPILASTLIGALLGTIVSYQGNKRWTFVKAPHPADVHQWLRFGTTALLYNLGNLALMVLLLSFLPQHPWLMQMITTAALTLITFRINQHWTFRHESIKT
ncbi:GtrA family protein [Pseudomonas costantinii]|uniref:Flippase GtrA (Transmembrane translocase of bactoprenol-linked glucose) n=2 Tax=Pseudomonas costantinii TaxID=168469 RepID=A0A1H5EEM1_9PSED|nr:GtrA family protein [Pseudomonas costantinii]SED89424.1 Putative flippase GtrA (transmembrane translocase of bactoprenol-linked glucose) [Pseudomonas costantinii]